MDHKFTKKDFYTRMQCEKFKGRIAEIMIDFEDELSFSDMKDCFFEIIALSEIPYPP